MLNLKTQKEDILTKAINKGLERLFYYVQKVPMSPQYDSKDGNTGGDNGRYGVIDTTGAHFERKWACHSGMGGFPLPLVVFNQYGHRKNILPEADKAYFSWITSDTGPWKSFKGRNISHVSDDWKRPVLDFIFENGWVWSDLDNHPSNLQHNFLVAGRMPQEWQSYINRWYAWTQKGLDPALCFVFLDVFSELQNDKDKYVINHKNKYDWPVDICTSSEEYVRNFCLGKIDTSVLNEAYSKKVMYAPVNRIFGVNNLQANDPKAYPNVIHSLYAGKFAGPVDEDCKEYWAKRGTGLASYSYVNHWFVTEEEILEIIHEETKRLKL